MALPPCHSRRELPTTPGVMYCVHPRVHVNGMVVREVNCRMCNYWKEPAPESFQSFPPPPPRGRCEFLGEVVAYRDCPTCCGAVRLKVFACSHPAHHQTVWSECLKCSDHREAGKPAPEAIASD